MTFASEIRQWDGKSVVDIEAVYNKYCDKKSFVAGVVSHIEKPACQKGATWLLKRHLETGNKISPADIKKVYACLPKLEGWESRLHVLQTIPYMPIENPEKKKVEIFLRHNLSDQNKFIRAWTYNGFYELARTYPEYMEETRQFFEMAMRDEAPSVKSRIRNILKQGF